MLYEEKFKEYLGVEKLTEEHIKDVYPEFEYAFLLLLSAKLTEEEALEMLKLADKMKWE